LEVVRLANLGEGYQGIGSKREKIKRENKRKRGEKQLNQTTQTITMFHPSPTLLYNIRGGGRKDRKN